MAATGQIKVNPQEMISISGQIEGEIGYWKNAVDKIYQYHSEMDAMWDGDANNTFNALFLEDKQKFTRLITMMDDYAKAIKVAANRYISCENAVKNIVSKR